MPVSRVRHFAANGSTDMRPPIFFDLAKENGPRPVQKKNAARAVTRGSP